MDTCFILHDDDDAFTTLIQDLETGRKRFEDVNTTYKMNKYFSGKMSPVKLADILGRKRQILPERMEK